MLHDPEAAADAVQDVFTRLWRMRLRLGMMKNARGYAMKTLQHACLDRLRHDKVMQSAMAEISPAENLDNEVYERLKKALSALPERQQRLIDLRYREQKSSTEMAEIMGISSSNVDTIMNRAYATLRKIMEDNNEEDGK